MARTSGLQPLAARAARGYRGMISMLVPGTPLARSDVAHKLLYGRAANFRTATYPRTNLFVRDCVLGWRHAPNTSALHASYEFRVRYHTDESGFRRSCIDGEPPGLVVLGCSWSFGHGVPDPRTFPYVLSSEHGLKAQNRGVSGYGLTHGLLLFRTTDLLKRAAAVGSVVAYVWCPEQLSRAWRRRSWIARTAEMFPGEAVHPVVDVVDGEVRPQGLIGPEQADDDRHDDAGVIEAMEWRMTGEIVRSMAAMADQCGVRFVLVLPPVRPHDPEQRAAVRMGRLLDRLGVERFDVDFGGLSGGAGSADGLFYRFDGHPTAAWNALVAAGLARALRA